MGLFFNHNVNSGGTPVLNIKYGYLYNAYAVNDVRNLANTDWHAPTDEEFQTLISYIGTDSAMKCAEVGTEYSIIFNPGYTATNAMKFNARRSGIRINSGGTFFYKDTEHGWYVWTVTPGLFEQLGYKITYNAGTNIVSTFRGGGSFFADGLSVRLVKDFTSLSNGEEGEYIGNDGTIYRTICIGTQEWLADNLAETKYRNGDTIPNVTNGTTWSELTTGALCAYDNDENNVFI